MTSPKSPETLLRSARCTPAGGSIRVATGTCSLGTLSLAASSCGVCAIFLGETPEALLHRLRECFPAAVPADDDVVLAQWVARVADCVEAPRRGLELPLDIHGTPFQRRVWDLLRQSLPGETFSYAEVARRIGAPRAARAVAQACGANLLALAIPCHRVVRRDGGLGGYRWGTTRKRLLLEREAQV